MKKIACVSIALILIMCISSCGIATPEDIEEMVLDDVVSKCESYGLKNVSVEVSNNGHLNKYLLFYLTVISSNFNSLSYDEMFKLTEELEAIDFPLDDGDIVMLKDFRSYGSKWKVFTDSLTIYQNNIEVYNDYENSNAHQEVEKEEQDIQYGNSFSTSVTDNSLKIDIWVCAQKIVKDSLKSPSTADFCKVTEAEVYSNGGDDYTVVGYVDAQNDLGAVVRNDFVVTLTFTGSGFKNGSVIFM